MVVHESSLHDVTNLLNTVQHESDLDQIHQIYQINESESTKQDTKQSTVWETFSSWRFVENWIFDVVCCLFQRNQFLEAESVEMEKERNQIRSGMCCFSVVVLEVSTLLANRGPCTYDFKIKLLASCYFFLFFSFLSVLSPFQFVLV